MAGKHDDRNRRKPNRRERESVHRADHATTPSWLRDDEAERQREGGLEHVSGGGDDREHEARKRGYGGDTGHDTSWSGPSSSTKRITPEQDGSRRGRK